MINKIDCGLSSSAHLTGVQLSIGQSDIFVHRLILWSSNHFYVGMDTAVVLEDLNMTQCNFLSEEARFSFKISVYSRVAVMQCTTFRQFVGNGSGIQRFGDLVSKC